MFKRWIAVASCMAASLVPMHIEAAETLPALRQRELSAWVTYWDYDNALGEALRLGDSLTSLIFFAAFFDENNEVIVPDELDMLYDLSGPLFDGAPPDRYISFVNDKITDDGTALLKDTGLLWELLGSPEGVCAHVNDLIALTQNYGFDGIEIDYEAIGGDFALWEHFLSFLTLLYQRADACGLKLRVMLEPSAPLAALTFPGGISYVMMCYNLYGGHSGPGPKADDSFIRALVHDMEVLPGNKGFALATGGFSWVEGQGAQSLTQSQAEMLAETAGKPPIRDEASGSLHFECRDGQGRLNTVWYADGVTLRRWQTIIAESGQHDISIWRLGGNRDIGE